MEVIKERLQPMAGKIWESSALWSQSRKGDAVDD